MRLPEILERHAVRIAQRGDERGVRPLERLACPPPMLSDPLGRTCIGASSFFVRSEDTVRDSRKLATTELVSGSGPTPFSRAAVTCIVRSPAMRCSMSDRCSTTSATDHRSGIRSLLAQLRRHRRHRLCTPR